MATTNRKSVLDGEQNFCNSVKTGESSWADRSDVSSSNETSTNSRFFLVKSLQGTFAQVSPFFIQKVVQSLIGETKSIKKLRSGDLLIEVFNCKQAENLHKTKNFGNIPVCVTPHGMLNSSRGVISEHDLLYVSEDELLENLKDQSVTGIRRIEIRKDGKTIPTKHIIVTFNTPTLPRNLKAGYLNCPIRPYIPNPLRCFQCQRFGHSKGSCRGTLTCARCSAKGHESENCSGPVRCVNCQGDHPSYSRSCEKWKTEKEIQTVRVKQNLSYPEARKSVLSRTPTLGVSYTAVTSKNIHKETKKYQTIATQTDAFTQTPNKSNCNNGNESQSLMPSSKQTGKTSTKESENSSKISATVTTPNLPPSKNVVQKMKQNKPQNKILTTKPFEKQQKRTNVQLALPVGKRKTPKVNVKSQTFSKKSFLKSVSKSEEPAISLYASDLSEEEEDGMSTTSESQKGVTEVNI